MNARAGDAAIIGIYATPIAKQASGSIRRLFQEVAIAALRDAGLTPTDVDGLVTTPPGLGPKAALLFAADLNRTLGLRTRALVAVENGGATAAEALIAAVDAVQSGRARHCLVLAADERPRSEGTGLEATLRLAAEFSVGLYGPWDGVYLGAYPVPLYAMLGQRYMHELGVTAEDLARVVVQLRAHAASHPGAQFRTPTTIEEVLAAPVQSPPLTVPMCCPVSTGAAGAVVTTVAEARRGGRPYVRVAGIGAHHEPEHFLPVALDRTFTTFTSAVEASAQAYACANITPAEIAVAEIYGAYAPVELMLYEDLGFVNEKGAAARAVKDGCLSHGGRTVLNPSGGRICYGHPVAATALLQVVEVVHQLRGTADGRQVPNARWGLTHAEHGCINGSVVIIYEASA